MKLLISILSSLLSLAIRVENIILKKAGSAEELSKSKIISIAWQSQANNIESRQQIQNILVL